MTAQPDKVSILFDVNGVFGREAAGANDCPANNP